MKDLDYILAGGILFILTVSFTVAFLFTTNAGKEWHKEAIQHHAAHYDAQTGSFEWNDSTNNAK